MHERRVFKLKSELCSDTWGTFPAGTLVMVALYDPETFTPGWAEPIDKGVRIPANDPFITTILANSERILMEAK